ncbi:type II toxin-antitoxin system RelE/ParE family toxin [Thermomonas sp.]|uniref:type II toxin-antitoxin system RelE/ParE family toxin n=1 Tax=Thermomonas sp. TaxID=1971895 RepID=UPI0024881D72|nr:type II toxin-antitoxin system RelE/ParE family toxin [Thermomonas sp.]MDI1254097.1 type II toxin-antitoxin system RelE/ParE family toxin [Thermomonas sp.]
MKPSHWHPQARRDLDEAATWLADQGGKALELSIVDALDATKDFIERHPGAGATRYATLVKIGELRFWPIKGFPYLVFYVERATHMDIWRVLHAHRDIPAWMEEAK